MQQRSRKHNTNLAILKDQITRNVIDESIYLANLQSKVHNYSALRAALHSTPRVNNQC